MGPGWALTFLRQGQICAPYIYMGKYWKIIFSIFWKPVILQVFYSMLAICLLRRYLVTACYICYTYKTYNTIGNYQTYENSSKSNYILQLNTWSYRIVHYLLNDMFEKCFWSYMALRMLYFLLYPFEMSILAQIVQFLRLCVAHMT